MSHKGVAAFGLEEPDLEIKIRYRDGMTGIAGTLYALRKPGVTWS